MRDQDALRMWYVANKCAAIAANCDRAGAPLLAAVWRKKARINRQHASQALRK